MKNGFGDVIREDFLFRLVFSWVYSFDFFVFGFFRS